MFPDVEPAQRHFRATYIAELAPYTSGRLLPMLVLERRQVK